MNLVDITELPSRINIDLGDLGVKYYFIVLFVYCMFYSFIILWGYGERQ